jgi:hypothetical protein
MVNPKTGSVPMCRAVLMPNPATFSAQGKIKALTEAKAHVVESPEEIAPKIKELI